MAVNKECCLLACDTLQPNRDFQSRRKKNPAALISAHGIVYPKYADSMFLQYHDKFLSGYIASHAGKRFSSFRQTKNSIAFREHVT